MGKIQVLLRWQRQSDEILYFLTVRTVDGNTDLDSCDDAASTAWGEGWRVPTKAEMEELKQRCKWTWTSLNGAKGYCVTGENGSSIFLPAAGTTAAA